MAAYLDSDRGNTRNPIILISKYVIPMQLLNRDLSLTIWACASSDSTHKNNPLAVSICIKLIVTANVCPRGRGVGQEVHHNMHRSHCPYCNPEIIGLLETAFSHPLSVGSQLMPYCVPKLVMEDASLLHHPNLLCLG